LHLLTNIHAKQTLCSQCHCRIRVFSLHSATTTSTDCAVCAAGYSSSIRYDCSKCSGDKKEAIYAGIIVILLLCAAGIIFLLLDLLGLGDGSDAISVIKNCGVIQKLASFNWNKLRIPIVAFQIVTQFINVTGLPLPDIYLKFLSWTDVFNLNLGWLLSLGCLTKIDFYQTLLITTLIPLAITAALSITHAHVRYRLRVKAAESHISQRAVAQARTARLEKALSKHIVVFLAMTFFIYSTVSTTVFQTFACDTIDDSAAIKTSYLRADYSIQCGTSEHTLYRIYAGFMVIIYPLSIPALYAWLLWRNRHKLSSNNGTSSRVIDRHDDNEMRSTRFCGSHIHQTCTIGK
jgi:hypothetical protein